MHTKKIKKTFFLRRVEMTELSWINGLIGFVLFFFATKVLFYLERIAEATERVAHIPSAPPMFGRARRIFNEWQQQPLQQPPTHEYGQ